MGAAPSVQLQGEPAHVVLPSDDEQRWRAFVEGAARGPVQSIADLKARMNEWCCEQDRIDADEDLDGLAGAISGTGGSLPSDEGGDFEKRFFSRILPSIISSALRLPHMLAGGKLQKLPQLQSPMAQSQATEYTKAAEDSFRGGSACIFCQRGSCERGIRRCHRSFPRTLAHSLLANMLLCTFRYDTGEKAMPNASFRALLRSAGEDDHGKIRMYLHYFDRTADIYETMGGHIHLVRRRVNKDTEEWKCSTEPLQPVELASLRVGILDPEAGKDCLHADFANTSLGGGVLDAGSLQEEILFAECPELTATMLLCPCMLTHEAIQITGAERFSQSSGYSDSLRFSADFIDTAPRAGDGTVKRTIGAIDAYEGRGGSGLRATLRFQLTPAYMLRELNKAMAGFTQDSEGLELGEGMDKAALDPFPMVATGNWGCGAFKGNLELKVLLQWLVCSEAGVGMRYFPFDQEPLRDKMAEIVPKLVAQRVTVGELWGVLLSASEAIEREHGAVEDYDADGVLEWEKRDVFLEEVVSRIATRSTAEGAAAESKQLDASKSDGALLA